MILDALLPAHNEATTVAGVVRAVLGARWPPSAGVAGTFRRVLVVDDGSTDTTAAEARAAGAEVLTLSPNRGKSGAVLAGIAELDARAKAAGEPLADGLGFLDTDLTTLSPEHVRLMVDHFALGFDMVCGTQDDGRLNFLQIFGPLMTGQRVVRRWVLDGVPETCWRGYAMEIVMNYVTDRGHGKTCCVPLAGLDFRQKTAKVGVVQGWLQHLAMARQMSDARASLEASDGRRCEIR